MKEEKIASNPTSNRISSSNIPLLAAALFGLLIFGLLSYLVLNSMGLTSPTKRIITVSGSANRQQANQKATFTATMLTKNADRAVAMADINQKSEKLLTDLKQFGIPENDLKTQSLNVYREQVPFWDNGMQKFKDGDWNASVSIDLTLRDVSRTNELTELLGKSDTSNIWGPNYSLSEDEPDKEVLLNQWKRWHSNPRL